MIIVVNDKARILAFHEKFHKRLDKFLTESIDCIVGYPSGSFPDIFAAVGVAFTNSMTYLVRCLPAESIERW